MEAKRKEPSCATCVHVDACDHLPVESVRGKVFCTQWQSKEPQPKGEDPNEAWERGDEAVF